MAKDLPEFVSVRELCDKFGCSRTTLYNRENAGTFPQRRKIGAHSVAWLKSEIEEYIANLPKGIDAAPRQLREAKRTGKNIARKKKKARPKAEFVTDPWEGLEIQELMDVQHFGKITDETRQERHDLEEETQKMRTMRK